MATSAPRLRQKSRFSAVPAVVNTRAPSWVASWIAKLPMPPAPPCTSSTSPGCSAATMNTIDHTVHATSGSAAAATRSTPSGTGISWPDGTATWVAYAPAESSAQAWSPTAQPSTPSPSAATVPLHSMPSTSDAPEEGDRSPAAAAGRRG